MLQLSTSTYSTIITYDPDGLHTTCHDPNARPERHGQARVQKDNNGKEKNSVGYSMTHEAQRTRNIACPQSPHGTVDESRRQPVRSRGVVGCCRAHSERT